VWARKCPIPSGNVPAIVAKGKRIQTSDLTANLGFEVDTFRHNLRSDTAQRDSAFLQTGGKLQSMTEGHDNWSKDATTCAGSSASHPRTMPTSPGFSTSSTISPRKAWPHNHKLKQI